MVFILERDFSYTLRRLLFCLPLLYKRVEKELQCARWEMVYLLGKMNDFVCSLLFIGRLREGFGGRRVGLRFAFLVCLECYKFDWQYWLRSLCGFLLVKSSGWRMVDNKISS